MYPAAVSGFHFRRSLRNLNYTKFNKKEFEYIELAKNKSHANA